MSGAASRLVLRNTLWLVAAQTVAAPLSLLINAVAARKLGPVDFGDLYLATTFSAVAFLLVEWGQNGTLTARIAQDRSRAGELLGSGLAWRLCAAPLVIGVLLMTCRLLGYHPTLLWVVTLVLVTAVFGTVSAACQDALRGFERTDVSALSYVGWQLLTGIVVVPTLLYGGGLRGFLLAQMGCAALGALVMLRLLAPLGVPRLAVRVHTGRELLTSGTAFMIFNLVMVLQPNLDAIFMSKFASPAAIGWYAAARKLTGIMIFPASALISALYPTLCRLRLEDPPAFFSTTASALRLTLIAAAPVAMGCLLFPRLATGVFGGNSYDAAATDLRLLAPYVLLLYLTMPLGTALLAAGRQCAWTAAQFICVLVSVTADPLLVPWLQRTTGNGGLGVCMATLTSEVLMLLAAVVLMPTGLPLQSLRRTALATATGMLAMAAVRLLPWALDPWLLAALALAAYALVVWFGGGVDPGQRQMLRTLLRRRAAPATPAGGVTDNPY